MFAHCCVEEDPLYKLLGFSLVCTVCSNKRSQMSKLDDHDHTEAVSRLPSCCTSESLHHHSRGRSVSLLQQTFTNGPIATRLPELQPLYCTLRRDFPGTQNSLGLWSAERSCSQRVTLLACLKITRDKLAPGIALTHG